MSYVLVTADFPGVSTDQRNKIYECLANKNWKKVTEFGRDISTTWIGYFDATNTEQRAKDVAKSHFIECSKIFCDPKLVIHWGPNEPIKYGLV